MDKRSFDVLYVDVCMVVDLTRGAVWIFRFCGVLKVGVSFIQETTVMSTRVVSGEVGHGTSEG